MLPPEFNEDRVETLERNTVHILEILRPLRETPPQLPVLPGQQQLQTNQVPQPPQQVPGQQQLLLTQQLQMPVSGSEQTTPSSLNFNSSSSMQQSMVPASQQPG